MEFSTWLLFLGFALIAIISPGPAVLLSVTNSLTHGFAKSLFSSLGNITGLFFVSGAAVLGLGAVLQASTVLFTILKTFGAVYLIYLGIRQWRAAGNIFEKSLEICGHNQGNGKTFIQGLLVAVSNPKAVVFLRRFFPNSLTCRNPF